MLVGKVAAGGPNKLEAGTQDRRRDYLDELPREQWFEIRLEDEEANAQLEQAAERLQRAAQGSSRSASRRRTPRSPRATTSPRACSRW